jgi:hypothetical protein
MKNLSALPMSVNVFNSGFTHAGEILTELGQFILGERVVVHKGENSMGSSLSSYSMPVTTYVANFTGER